jgi:hypothetical protein
MADDCGEISFNLLKETIILSRNCNVILFIHNFGSTLLHIINDDHLIFHFFLLCFHTISYSFSLLLWLDKMSYIYIYIYIYGHEKAHVNFLILLSILGGKGKE